MMKFNAHVFYAIAQDVELVRSGAHFTAATNSIGPRKPVPEPIKTEHPKTLKAVLQHCKDVGLNFTVPHVERMLESFEDKYGVYDCGQLDYDSNQLHLRILDEMRGILFLRIPGHMANFYDQSALFGQAVADSFKNATYDITEAGSCYATDRYTACVMHLMRALEVSLDAAGLGVGVSSAVVEARHNWDGLLKKIVKQMDINDAAGDPLWKSKRRFFADVHSQLCAVKNAWRNPSMHLERKYDEQDAGRIFNAVKDFMQLVATHLDDTGTFTP